MYWKKNMLKLLGLFFSGNLSHEIHLLQIWKDQVLRFASFTTSSMFLINISEQFLSYLSLFTLHDRVADWFLMVKRLLYLIEIFYVNSTEI